MKIYFVLPPNTHLISGGNLYNAHLIAELKKQYSAVEIINFSNYQQLIETKENAIFFIDTLFMEQLAELNWSENNRQKKHQKNYLITHHLESLYPPKNWTQAQYFNQKELPILKQLDGFLATSKFTQNYLINKGLKHKHIFAISPALCFKPLVKTRHYERLNALVVANLVERKGILPLLKTLAKQQLNAGDFTLTIIGTNTIEPAYAKQCADLINSNKFLKNKIKLLGALPQKEVESYYQKSNLFISAASMETYGMALQEAVAYRLPLLVLEGGNSKNHVIKNTNGFVFTNLETLVNYLIKLIEQPILFKTLLEKTWQHEPYENYTWEVAASNFLEELNLVSE